MDPGGSNFEAFDHDVIVVGGGPIGAEVARIAAHKGNAVAIFEEHNKIGRPVQCGGLVSSKVLRITKYDKVINTLWGADIHSPGGNKVSFMAPQPRAFVLDREEFDTYMVDRARKEGVKVHTSTKVLGAEYVDRGRNGISVKIRRPGNDDEILRCRLLIGADGVQRSVSKWFGLARPHAIVSGYEMVYSGLDLDPKKAIVVSGKRLVPGFFGWIIPLSSEKALVGLGVQGSNRPASHHFKVMVNNHPMKDILSKGKKGVELAGCIPLGIRGRSFSDRVMIVGDAAAQVKPLSGGGLYVGLMAAKHCGRVAAEALEADDLSKRWLRQYHERWYHSVGKEIRNGALLRKLYLNLSDPQIDELIEIIGSKDLLPLIVDYGDIDSPSILAKVMVKRAPNLLKFTGPLLRSLL